MAVQPGLRPRAQRLGASVPPRSGSTSQTCRRRSSNCSGSARGGRPQVRVLPEPVPLRRPPHGGFMLGIDRLVAILAGEENIREVIALPQDAERRRSDDQRTDAGDRQAARRARDPCYRRSTNTPGVKRLRTVTGVLDLGLDPDVWPWIWLSAAVIFAPVGSPSSAARSSSCRGPCRRSSPASSPSTTCRSRCSGRCSCSAGRSCSSSSTAGRSAMETRPSQGVGADRLVGMTGIVTTEISPDDEIAGSGADRGRSGQGHWDGDGGIPGGTAGDGLGDERHARCRGAGRRGGNNSG